MVYRMEVPYDFDRKVVPRMGIKAWLDQKRHKEVNPPIGAVAQQLGRKATDVLSSFYGSDPSVFDAILQLFSQDVKAELKNLGIVAASRRGTLKFTPLGYKVIDYLGES